MPPPAALLTGAGELAEKDAGQTGQEPHGLAEDGAAFTCPMHPEVAATEPGQCPICGMTLLKKSRVPAEERP